MIEFGGTVYYIDLAHMDKLLVIPLSPVIETETTTIKDESGEIVQVEIMETKIDAKNKEVDGVKYDIIKMFIEVILGYRDDGDGDSILGADHVLDKKPLSFKIAFNTLLTNGILKEME